MRVAKTFSVAKNLIFVGGKGGVGKTTVSRALAEALVDHSATARVLWVEFESPRRPPGELREVRRRLFHLNCEAGSAFEEYLRLKLGGGTITRFFAQNKLIRYLAQAAPGIHELVLLGKVWHERKNYDHVVVDMRSTGYGLAMFQSVENFAKLFQGGPIHRDARQMLDTLRDPEQAVNLIVALPEEMPLRESLEMRDILARILPGNAPRFLVNRRYPSAGGQPIPLDFKSPLPSSLADYAVKRAALEEQNLATWREAGVDFNQVIELPFIAPAFPPAARAVGQARHPSDDSDETSRIATELAPQLGAAIGAKS